MSDATIAQLWIYPVKSCRGIALNAATLTAAGLQQDRRWMVVDDAFRFITQREVSRLSLVVPQLDANRLHLQAPGMEPLQVDMRSDRPVLATVWKDTCKAFDEGDAAAHWFSTFLGRAARLVRFDESHQRLSDSSWTDGVAAPNRFSDGFPLLLASRASLAELNSRLAQPLTIDRFRPNILIDGVTAYAEDEMRELTMDAIRLRVVKPCTRCKITTIDQQRGEASGVEPLATLAQYRRNPQLHGVTFGQNVIVVQGEGQSLQVGQSLRIQWR